MHERALPQRLLRLSIIGLLACAGLSLAAASEKGSQLCQAIERNRLDQAQAALAAGEDVNQVFEKDTMLCRAIAANQVDIAKLILQSPKVDVNKRGTFVDGFNNQWERTPLILASKRGFTELVDLLLDRGADVNARDRIDGSPLERGGTALIWAASGDHLETLQALFNHSKKPDVNLRNKDGASALWKACENESLEAVKLLLAKGAKPNLTDYTGRSVLTTTFLHKKFEILDLLAANGADINLADTTGSTPLMAAITSNHSKRDIVLKWLEHFFAFRPKVDLQPATAEGGGESALLQASRVGFLEAMNLLIEHGANVNLASKGTARTPLATAVLSKKPEAVKLLIKHGAKTELADKSACTPLLLAVLQADPDMVQLLLEGGAQSDFKAAAHNITPLVAAAINLDPFKHGNCLKIIRILLEHKADINFQASDGRTALMGACASSDPGKGLETATLLLDRGANVDTVNNKGESALMLAAGNGSEKVVKLLLKKGADVQLKSGAGESAVNFAQRSGNAGVVALLEAKGAKASAPTALAKVMVQDLLGTWVGQQDGMPQAIFNLTLKRDNTFDFVSRFTPETLKKFPKGSVNPVIAAQKGSYTINKDILVLNIRGAAPFSRHWKLDNGQLILDNLIRLKRTK
ncbi:MAG: Ankyrin [Holophagaceae bacterium]|nr:Ankyrin [Holophagaceae bacterium]